MITFDSLMLQAFVSEEKDFIQSARINKIQQPTRREIIFNLRNNGKNRQLYINISPQFFHICFMSEKNIKKRQIKNPLKPPMFCMLLRKYLNNAKIAKIEQPQNERILEFYFETYNELGDKIYLCLAIELMGKHSNVILYNTDTNIILGCAHNVGADKSQVREVYGQIPYTYPPEHSSKYFIEERYAFLFNYLSRKSSCHCEQSEAIQSFYENINSIIDNYYAALIEKNIFKSLKSKYQTEINSNLKKVTKSLKEMEYQLLKNNEGDKYRLWGDLIMANLYNLKDYSSEIEVFDYENNCRIKIKLKKEKTLKENANIFYKKYNKSKTANTKLEELIEIQKQQKQYFEQILYSLEISKDIEELKEIEQEIQNLHSNSKTIKTNTNIAEKIIHIDLPNQTRIYIGKNNKQNDYIISKLASEDDLWFHTKDCAGSHVLLKTQNITDELILKCATLAKENSQGADSSKIGVIYTKRKYLRKPPKANLGYVTYRNEKEIIID